MSARREINILRCHDDYLDVDWAIFQLRVAAFRASRIRQHQ